jgi:hypothetical protein
MMTFGHDFVLVGRHNGIGSLPSAITAIADRSNITAIVKRVFIVGYLVLDSHHHHQGRSMRRVLPRFLHAT